ncbi:MAG: Gfo/Idh/MocA family oxidoreductase [Saprospiraceae bacterium]|nr:Gfo/Idh/MocA family oxidoreductase [Saprospiraceae bacterium]
MKNFALLGLGYIAERHLKAIQETNNNLLVAMDPHDSVGILDDYFPHCEFYSDRSQFISFLEVNSKKTKLDYFSICSPNFLHESHIRMAIEVGAHAICEKPLVITPQSLDILESLETHSQCKIYTILQLRHHPSILNLKEQQLLYPKHHRINLQYITSRGHWYHNSWKGDEQKSGGILTNIGIHFFDMLLWIYGQCKEVVLFELSETVAKGRLELEYATVDWFLSIDRNHLPSSVKIENKSTYRALTIDDVILEFTDGFKNLHTVVYENILAQNGFGIRDSRPSIELVHQLRHSKIHRSY